MTVPAYISDPIMALREGFGKNAIGGVNGDIHYVTTLADSGPGSFREAWESSTALWIRFDGLAGNIDLASAAVAGSGYKTIDARDAAITFRGDGAGLGGIYANDMSDLIFFNFAYDGQFVPWDVDDEGNDGLNLRACEDVFCHSLSFTHCIDGAIDSPGVGYSRRLSIVNCRVEEVLQGTLLYADDVSVLRCFSKNQGMRLPAINNGRAHVANNLFFGWRDAKIQNAKVDTGYLPADYAEIYAERNLYLPGSVATVGKLTNGGKIQRSNEIQLAATTFVSGGTVDSAFVAAAQATTTVRAPSNAFEIATLRWELEGAGPDHELRSVWQVGRAVGNSATIPIASVVPGGIRQGDLAVVRILARSTGSAPAAVVPLGFELIASAAQSQMRGMMEFGILTGLETTIQGPNGDIENFYIVEIYRGNRPITSATLHSVNTEDTNSNPSPQTIAASAQSAGDVTLCLGQMIATGSIGTRTTTMLEAAGATNRHWAHHWIFAQTEAPANISYDMGDSGSNILQSCYLALA